MTTLNVKKMTRVKFVSTVSKMGGQRVIVIPKAYHKDIEKLEPRQVKVIVEDEL